MIEVKGKYVTAKVMRNDLDQHSEAQIKALCDNKIFFDQEMIFMPDVHPGKVAPVGLYCTVDLVLGIIPSLIGPDIGCGVSFIKIKPPKKGFDWNKLDNIIEEFIPTGQNIHTKSGNYENYYHDFLEYITSNFVELRKLMNIDIDEDKVKHSMGTLGSGNHFIEIAKGKYTEDYYLIVHTGSRNFGWQIYNGYLNHKNIIRKNGTPYELGVLCNEEFDQYETDSHKATIFAYYNRKCIIDTICKKAKFKQLNHGYSIMHNYIYPSSFNNYTVHKGSIHYEINTPTLIPVNSYDGSILAYMKNNDEWRNCAPHGSGRKYGRKDVANHTTASIYKRYLEEKKIHCKNAGKDTLEESPFAYRSIADIDSNIGEILDRVIDILEPVYNYKAKDN